MSPADSAPVAVVGMGLILPGAGHPDQYWDLLHHPHGFVAPPPDRADLDTFPFPGQGDAVRPADRACGYLTDPDFHPRLRAELDEGRFAEGDHATLWLRHSMMQALEGVTVRPDDRGQYFASMNVQGSPRLEESLLVDRLAQLLADVSGDQDRAGLAAALRPSFPRALADASRLLPYRAARHAVDGLLPQSPGILVMDSACVSLHSVDLSAEALRAGECDLTICSGANVVSRLFQTLLTSAPEMASHASLRSFDRDSEGTVYTDGAAAVVLKLHERAVADGDHVLGVLHGFGATADGRGSTLYRPSVAGVARSLRRALGSAGIGAEDVDWIIAHGSGIPLGDKAELSALYECATPAAPWLMTGNKSAIGHGGPASGMFSLVHALLAMRHQTIPGQLNFAEPTLPELVGERLRIPTNSRPWPARPDGPRRVAIAMYGVGGTNSHVIFGDRPPEPAPDPATAEPLVVVGWTADLPGRPEQAEVRNWLTSACSGKRTWPDSFGDQYPLPTLGELRIPPRVLRQTDRSHLMALFCADELWSRLGDARESLRDNTGVLLGLSGSCRNEAAYLGVAGAAYAGHRLSTEDGQAVGGIGPGELARLAVDSTPPPTVDSLTGLVSNVASSRICWALDLHGRAIAVDAGADSGLAALDLASRYLRTKALDLCLVGAVSGHHTASLPFNDDGREAAEGGFMLAVTRASTARAHDLPVLGRLRNVPAEGTQTSGPATPYGPADRLVAVLSALHGEENSALVQPVEDTATRAIRVAPTASPPDEGVWQLPVTDADRALLATHLVDGRPTFPATLLIDHAAKAAGRLAPGLRPLRVTDVELRCFTRVRADGSVPPLQVRTRRLPELTPGEIPVHVSIGVVPDRSNVDMVVHLGRAHPASAPFRPGVTTGAHPVADPYHVPGSPVALSGALVALENLVVQEGSVTARYVPDFPRPDDLRGHGVPVIALDCLIRTAALGLATGEHLPIAVPTRIPRIDLHTGDNDLTLPRGPSPLVLSHDAGSGTTRLSEPETGRVLVTMHDITLHPLGWWSPGSDEFSETREP
ncbi:beta-ketoacyl synthase N-terminal-like domain-containing protein [Amycolatopsis sp. NPDC088138]|uniref:hotdog fold thioesterase n=1 Tax=Amycolatopsis sp. NPDC088138 TaxID=3363938 RepID=UPI0037FAE347